MMDVRWTLNIENFGKIERAEIEISPLMLFVGDNNSGKSYVMSLLWGILTFAPSMFNSPSSYETTEYKRCEEWLKTVRCEEMVTIDTAIETYFVEWFNIMLNRDKEKIVERVFNYQLPIGNLSISDFCISSPIKIRLTNKFDYDEEDFDDKLIRFPNDMDRKFMLKSICLRLLITNITGVGDPLYLPASRTGFMLSYKTLLANLIDPHVHQLSLKDENQYRSELPLSVTRFLRLLVQTKITPVSQYKDVADFIEQKIMMGQVYKDVALVPNFIFRPSGGQEELPLHVTSSLVSELSPIVLFLRAMDFYSPYIIEEPEAHLHLKMQKLLITALVRLVNRGLPIWLTTHSDTLLQQVNNMIKLFNHSDREQLAQELGYDVEIDPLDPNDVTAYQFSVRDDGTTFIEPLQRTKYGFAVPTFYETLVNLTDETLKLQESEEDAD